MRDGWQHNVTGADSLVALYARLGDMPQPFNVTVKHGEAKRTITQNGLFHAWMGDIAKATHDDPASVKADCHIRWGIPIFRGEDAAYAAFIERALGGLHRGQVKAMIEAGYIPCTSLMSKATLSRYMDAVWREYSPHVTLLDPEEMKWRPKMTNSKSESVSKLPPEYRKCGFCGSPVLAGTCCGVCDALRPVGQ